MELRSSIETTAFITASPDFQRGILFPFIIFHSTVSSVSIRKYLAFTPRSTKGTWPSKWPTQVPATSTLPLTKHFPLHGSVFCRPETYLPSLERIPFWSHFLTYIAQTDSSSSTSLFPFIHACRSYNFFILAIEGLPSKSFLTSNKTLFPKRIQIGCSTHLSAPLSYSWLSKE